MARLLHLRPLRPQGSLRRRTGAPRDPLPLRPRRRPPGWRRALRASPVRRRRRARGAAAKRLRARRRLRERRDAERDRRARRRTLPRRAGGCRFRRDRARASQRAPRRGDAGDDRRSRLGRRRIRTSRRADRGIHRRRAGAAGRGRSTHRRSRERRDGDRAVREPSRDPEARNDRATTATRGSPPRRSSVLRLHGRSRPRRPTTRPSPALLANADPAQFDALYDDLAPSTRALVDELSPLARIADVCAPVELASSPDDCFFPVEESLALARAGEDVRLTVTPALLHVYPRLRPGLFRIAARARQDAPPSGRRRAVEPTPGVPAEPGRRVGNFPTRRRSKIRDFSDARSDLFRCEITLQIRASGAWKSSAGIAPRLVDR